MGGHGAFRPTTVLGAVWCFWICASAVDAGNLNADAWSRFYNNFAVILGADASTAISFMTKPAPIGAAWDITGSFETSKFCGSVPKWSVAYEAAGHTVVDAYSEAVHSYADNGVAPALQATAYAARTNATKARTMHGQCITMGLRSCMKAQGDDFVRCFWDSKLKAEYTAMCSTFYGNWVHFAALYKDTLFSGWEGERTVARAWTQLVGPDYYMNMTNYAGIVSTGPYVSLVPYFADTKNRSLSGQGTPGSVTISSASSTNSVGTFASEGAVKSPGPWLSVSGETTTFRATVDTSSRGFYVRISWDDMSASMCERFGWLNLALLNGRPNGPWDKRTPLGTGEYKMWGPHGLLGLLPTSIITMYKPTATVTLPSEDFEALAAALDGAHTACVFGICFGGTAPETGTGQLEAQVDRATRTIVLSDTSEELRVLAVKSLMHGSPGSGDAKRPRHYPPHNTPPTDDIRQNNRPSDTHTTTTASSSPPSTFGFDSPPGPAPGSPGFGSTGGFGGDGDEDGTPTVGSPGFGR